MRITFILPGSMETAYGIRIAGMAGALGRRGHAVKVFALHHDLQPSTPRRQRFAAFDVEYVGQMHVRKVGSQKYYFSAPTLLRVALASTWRLTAAAARQPCDLVHVGKTQPINGLAGFLAARVLRRKPLFLDCDDYEAVNNRFSARWQQRTVRFFEDGLPRHAAGLTAITHFMVERLAGLGIAPERIAYLPNGVDMDRFRAPVPGKVEAFRSLWGLEDRAVVGYVGTLSLTNHAVDLLLEAFARMHTRHPEAVLLMVGGGEDMDELRRMAARLGIGPATRFVGRVAPDDVPLCYAACQLTVDPVRDDVVARSRSPLKIAESLAAGTPVVTGDVGDRRQMLDNGQAGLLVAPGDATALAAGIESLLCDPDRRRGYAEAALAASVPLRWSSLVQVVEALYLRCLSPTCF